MFAQQMLRLYIRRRDKVQLTAERGTDVTLPLSHKCYRDLSPGSQKYTGGRWETREAEVHVRICQRGQFEKQQIFLYSVTELRRL